MTNFKTSKTVIMFPMIRTLDKT